MSDVKTMPKPTERYPLSPAQRRIWTGQRREPDSPLYHMAFVFHLPTGVDRSDWCEAFWDVVEEADALRTVVIEQEGVPECRVLPLARFAIESANPTPDATKWAEARARQTLALDQRMWDVVWLEGSDGAAAWYLNLHHLITDGVSIVRVMERHHAHYRRRRGLDHEEEPPLPSYATLAESVLRDAQASDTAAFWSSVCATAPCRLPLFGQHAEPESTHSRRRTICLTPDQIQGVGERINDPAFRGFTPDAGRFNLFATLVTAWLSRITGERTLTLDCPVHNRTTPNARRAIGLFIETLPVTVQVDPGASFAKLAVEVRTRNLDVLKNAHPGTQLPAGWRGAPAVLNVITTSFPLWEGEPVPVDWIHPGHADRDHRVRIQVHDFAGSGQIILHLDWLEDAVPAADQERATAMLSTLLDALLANPETIIDSADILSTHERSELLDAFNDTGAAPLPAAPITQHIARDRDSVAVSCGDAGWTYRELDQRVEAIAQGLHAVQIGAGSLVGLYLGRSMEALAAVLAVLRAGAAFVPLDPSHPPQRLLRIAKDARLDVLLTEADATLDGYSGPRLMVRELTASEPREWPALQLSDLAYVIYTSGSTGDPKGVEIEHAGLTDYLEWAARVYSDGPVTMPWFTSLSFDLTLTSLFLPLLTGGTVQVYPEGDGPVDDAIRRVVDDNRCDTIKLTPAHLSIVRQLDLSDCRVRCFILGGEDLKAPLAAAIQKQIPHAALYNEYGPTEAVVGCMLHRFDARRDCADSVPIGGPADHVELLVLNEALQPVPRGVPGELCIARYGLARGYHGAPGQTDAVFVPHPFRSGERIYRTGDRVRFSAPGCLTYLGRIDRQLKIRGIRIEPGEIEASLTALPGVREAAVQWTAPRPPETGGEACSRCGITDTVPGVRVDAGGLCNLCRSYDAIGERAEAYFRGMEDLRREIDAAQTGNRSGYDCMVLLSGGKDSTYTLGQVVGMGYRVFAFTLDNGYISDGAKENIRRVAGDFGVDQHFETTEHMPEIFRDSLRQFSNVCQGCFKAIYTLAINRADAMGIPVIVTGLSRGQFFETRLTDHLFREDGFSPDAVDDAVLAARKVYHRMDDAVSRCLDISRFKSDDIFDRVRIVDFFRYCDVSLEEMHRWLREEVPWIRPGDTGRSTNCLINDVGIYVHRRERSFHNYALPYSWDVRLGHKTRDEAVDELDDDIDLSRVRTILSEIDYPEPPDSSEGFLVAYVTGDDALEPTALRAQLAPRLPEAAVPQVVLQLERLPLAPSGKVDYHALPAPLSAQHTSLDHDEPPATDVERRLAGIWQDILQRPRIGRHHHFFDVGGHSLAAMEMMYRMCREFAVDLPLSALFETPVLCELAERVEGAAGGTKAAAQVALPRPSDAAARLAPEQRGLWTLHRVAPDDPAYHLVSMMRITGSLDADRLQSALNKVADRHRILRSAWHPDGDSAIQVIEQSTKIPLDTALEGELKGWVVKPFDLEKPPPLRMVLIPDDCLVAAMPHLVCDEQGLKTFWQDLACAYNAEPWTDDAVQYDDMVWTREQEPSRRESDLAYWRKKLETPFSVLTLPGMPEAGEQAAGGLVMRSLDPELADQVNAFARLQQITPFAVYLAAYFVLLRRMTGKERLAVGCPVSTRERPDEKDVIGYFLNAVLLSLPTDGSASFAEVACAMQNEILEAMEHRRLPFDQLVEALQPARAPGQSPWFQTMMVMADELSNVKLGDAILRPELIDFGVAKFDLTLFVSGQWIGAEFRTNRYAKADMEALLERYLLVLQQAVDVPDRPMNELDVLLPTEHRMLLTEWQPDRPDASPAGFVRDQILQQCGERAVRSGKSNWSYAELQCYAARIQSALQAQGVKPGDRVAIRLERSAEMVGAILGVHCAGAAYVPLDPAWPDARNQQVLEDADLAATITQHTVDNLPVEQAKPVNLNGDLPAYLIYTSGSTGRPKGVVVTHANLRASTTSRLERYPERPDAFLLLSGFAFDSSVAGLFWTLVTGGTLVIPSSEAARDPAALRDQIEQHRVTHVLGIPSLVRELVRNATERLSSLRAVIVAGETCSVELVEVFRASLPGVRLYNEYGPTEATVWATVWEDEGVTLERVPIGRPAPHARVYVLDGHRQPVLPGQPGTCWIGGAGVAHGYWRQDELTADQFVSDPFADAVNARMYNTGDRVRWCADGALEFLGRVDDQFKVNGVRLEPGDIESVLREVEGVRDAHVVLQPPAASGDIDALTLALDGLTEDEAITLLSEAKAVQSRPGEAVPERVLGGDGYELAFRSDPQRFLRTPRPQQRDWMLSQAFSEMEADLQHLDELAGELVPGEGSRFREQYPDIAQAALSDQEIMEDWQVPLMEAMADFVAETKGDVLEIGFGRGVSAELIQQRGVRSHTIVEPNPHSIEQHFQPWRAQWPDRDIRLLKGRWQDVLDATGEFDGIFFHAFPLNEQEFVEHILRSVTYAEHAIPELAKRLRPGGVFTYLSTEVDSLSRRHQRMLFDHFRTITTRVVELSVPEHTRDAWWAPRMVVVRAER